VRKALRLCYCFGGDEAGAAAGASSGFFIEPVAMGAVPSGVAAGVRFPA
jgi:hypothetical protein